MAGGVPEGPPARGPLPRPDVGHPFATRLARQAPPTRQGDTMTGFTPGELLALYAILTTSRAPGAPALARKVHHEYQNAPRGTNEEESQ